MELFIKNEEGELAKASLEDVTNPEVQLFDAEGKEIERPKEQKLEAPAIKVDPSAGDSEKELANAMKELAVAVDGLNAYKEEKEKTEAKLRLYQEASKRGFILPDGSVNPKMEEDEGLFHYDMARQGKVLNDKYTFGHQIDDAQKRKEIAQYFVLVTQAGFLNDDRSRKEVAQRYGTVFDREIKTGSTAIGDSGNEFVVPEIVESEILHLARERSIALQDANVVDMTSEITTWPVESTGVSHSWGNTTSESTPTVSEVQLIAKELSSYAEIRNTTLADSRSDIVSWLTMMMVNEVGQELDNQMFNGTGDPVSGLLTAKTGLSVVMGTGSSAFSNIDDAFLSEMIAALDGVLKEGAKFYYNGIIQHYVRTLKDNNGQLIFQPNVGSPVPGTIYGFPYKEAVKCPGTSAANTAFIVFANLRNFYIGRRMASMTLTVNNMAATPFTTNRTWFKLYNRWALEQALPNGMVRGLTAS